MGDVNWLNAIKSTRQSVAGTWLNTADIQQLIVHRHVMFYVVHFAGRRHPQCRQQTVRGTLWDTALKTDWFRLAASNCRRLHLVWQVRLEICTALYSKLVMENRQHNAMVDSNGSINKKLSYHWQTVWCKVSHGVRCRRSLTAGSQYSHASNTNISTAASGHINTTWWLPACHVHCEWLVADSYKAVLLVYSCVYSNS